MKNITSGKVDVTAKNLLILSNETEVKVLPLIEIIGISLKPALLITVETRQERYEISSRLNGTEGELDELFEKLKGLLSDFFSQGA